MKTQLVVALISTVVFSACGPELEPVKSAETALSAGERCTVNNKSAEWECCGDDQVSCDGRGGMVVCQSHKLVALTPEHCATIASNSRRPELAHLCNWPVCGTPADF